MTNATCIIDDCYKPVHVKIRGWCRTHYNRWWNHGDPLHLTPWSPPPQNRPRTIGCKVDGCDAKHSSQGYCKRHYMRSRYRANIDRITIEQAAYRADPDRREKAKTRSRDWRKANPDRMRELNRKYAREHADALREKRREYRDQNRDLIRALNNRRKALQRNVQVNDLTPAQWRQIATDWHGCCAYCGCLPTVLTMDHVVPLSRGGHHTATNVVPACGPCNSRKSDGPAPPFVNPPT